MPIQIHRDVEYSLSFLQPPRHEAFEDYQLPVDGPEKTHSYCQSNVPGTADAPWLYAGIDPRPRVSLFAFQPVSWQELLDTCISTNSECTFPEDSWPPSPTPLRSEPASQPSSGWRYHSSDPVVKLVMAKKRRSLQSIFIPPFFHPALSASSPKVSPTTSVSSQSAQTQRFRSHSAAASIAHFELPPAIPISPTPDASSQHTPRNSPPSDLLDDDPFADLSPSPSVTMSPDSSLDRALSPTRSLLETSPSTGPSLVHTQTPRSPLAQSFTEADEEMEMDVSPWSSPPRTPPVTPASSSSSLSSPVLRRQKSSQIRPAYTRPAFTPRPSLPSLHILSRMTIVAPKVKRGRVGAKLPAEPWNLEDDDASEVAESFVETDSKRSSLITIKDFREIHPDTESLIETSPNDQDSISAPGVSSDSDLQSLSYSTSADDDDTIFRPPQLSRTQSDPTPSCSAAEAPFSHASDSDSSSEASVPSTQPSNENLAAAYSRQPTVSVYGDLSSALDYDYLHAISRLDRAPSPQSYPVYSHSARGSECCDIEVGTSAETVRNVIPPPSMSHQRSISNTSIWTFNMADDNPVVPRPANAGLSTSGSIPSPLSTVSTDYEDDVEYFSFPSSSSMESVYMSAPASRSASFAGPSSSSAGYPTYGELDDEDGHESESQDSSVPDITARLMHLSPPEPSDRSSYYHSAEEHVDGGDGGYRAGGGSHNDSASFSSANGGWRQGGGASASGRSSGGGGTRNGSGAGGRDDDDDERRPRGRPGFPPPRYADSSESESEDSEEEAEDADEPPRPGRLRKSKTEAIPPPDTPSTDDDVPLAQRLPTALQAQKSIRRQVRAEHEQRRRAKSLRRPDPSDSIGEVAPPVPSGHANSFSININRIRKPSIPDAPVPLSVPIQPAPRTRPRTNTMPSKVSSPFSMGDLTKKLLDLQASMPPLPSASPRGSTSRIPLQDPSVPVPGSPSPAPTKGSIPEASTSRLRSMRSFHRPQTATEQETVPTVPNSSGTRLGRSATTVTRRRPEELPASPQLPSAQPGATLERKRSGRSHSRRPSVDQDRIPRPIPSPLPPREDAGADLQRKRSARSQSRRPSIDRGRPSNESSRPPVPPLPGPSAAPAKAQASWHQRIFVGSLQRFSQVEMTALYTARDVLELLQNQGALDNGTATGWMLWEVCQDFGMERPIRSFEVVSEVCNSWLADKTVNMVMAKKTSLATKLSRAAIPTSSPLCSGFVQHEYKKGKWQKRWMELREHSLWLSKREGGKDQVMLCSMNNFDAYVVTRVGKAPKGYVFAVKSTDNISYFESTSDYVHTFSVPEKEGENWLEKILLARSYIIHQERNVIIGNANTSGIGASLSRAGTRKRPAQPLVNFGGPVTVTEPSVPTSAVFEPGSLLAKRSH